MEKFLFISVDGQQIYLESLFLPILAPLNDDTKKIDILQFCLDDSSLRSKLQDAVTSNNMSIYFGKYFNAPPVIGSFLFIVLGAIKLFLTIKKSQPSILMPRSLVAGAMVLLVKPFFKNLQIVFETDGLMADERIDFGGWSKTGVIYKLFRSIEKKLVKTSVSVTTRTNKAKNILLQRTSNSFENKIYVIPNGKAILDLNPKQKELYRKEIREQLGFQATDLVCIYVGSIGKQYEPNKMFKIFAKIHEKNPTSKMIVLTPNIEETKNILEDYPLLNPFIHLDSVASDDVHKYTSASDFGLSLRTPSFSQQGICPLKLIDYLQVGIPVIANKGVGDLDELFDKYSLGYIIEDVNSINYSELLEFTNSVKLFQPKNLNKIAQEEFSLSLMVDKYQKLYEKVL